MKEFLKILTEKCISFEEKDGKIIIKGSYMHLGLLTSLPANTTFNNDGGVYLPLLTPLPANTVFNNGGYVHLGSLTSLPENTVFNNGGDVYLNSLTSLPENTVFNNDGDVWLNKKLTKDIFGINDYGIPHEYLINYQRSKRLKEILENN